jgi:hypothetical protein
MTNGILHLHLLMALIFVVAMWKGSALWWRMAAGAGVLLLITGVFNFMTRMTDPPAGWHAGIGIKVLLALHAIAMSVLLARGTASPEKGARWRKGALITAGLAMLIGLYFSNFARG